MRLCFTEQGWDDYRHWIDTDREILERVNRLIEDVTRNLFKGIGKPEPLKGGLTGWWSRRITEDHRLIYAIAGAGEEQRIVVTGCRYHYGA